MSFIKTGIIALFSLILCNSCHQGEQQNNQLASIDMMIRIAEIEIRPEYLNEYLSILKKESEASMRLEPGVISIFPMYKKESPNEIKILEIYINKAAYDSHLQTSHFKDYKISTLNIVKSLKLIEMEAIDEGTMSQIFYKLKE